MSEITLKDVLDHLQAMEQRLTRRIDLVDARQVGLATQLTQCEAKLSWQIDSIDERLDEVEIARLPQRVQKLEKAIGV